MSKAAIIVEMPQCCHEYRDCEYSFLYNSDDRPLFCCGCELSYYKDILREELKNTWIYKLCVSILDVICRALM